MATPGFIKQKCLDLQGSWLDRTKKHREWYDILLLTDELEQEGMESVTTNDPRTAYNLALHLLLSMIIADRIPSDELRPEEIESTAYLEKYVAKRWEEQEQKYRSRGRRGWTYELFSWMLALGWYSVFSMVTDDAILAEVWPPSESFPAFGPDGLIEHAHIYTLPAPAAARKLKMMGWTTRQSLSLDQPMIFYDHWGYDLDGNIANSIVMSGSIDEFVKEPQVDQYCDKVGRLPVFTSPVGGLPDMGSVGTSVGSRNLLLSKKWQRHFGESIVAVNEDIGANYNRMRTFLQQAARYAAQPHVLELSSGDTPIATESSMDRWGSILRGAQGDSVSYLQAPAIPVELSSMLFTYQNEMQRGLFPYALYGNIQQQLSYLAMANIASASLQVLTPYETAFQGLRTDLANFWMDMIFKNKIHPYRFKAPKGLPDEDMRRFTTETSVEIPGYMVQRATVARMMNPHFTLPERFIMERLFPEIRNPVQARGEVRAEEAMRDPRAIMVDSILAYREQAKIRRDRKDNNGAKLYEKLANALEKELEAGMVQLNKAPNSTPNPLENELNQVSPQGMTQPNEGLGRI